MAHYPCRSGKSPESFSADEQITSFIVIGFAAIGAEIENPFGYDKNDLNLDFFCNEIICQELAAITARPFPPPEEWVFSAQNQTLGVSGVGADKVVSEGMQTLREGLKSLGGGGQAVGRSRASSGLA
jgi:putative membrane protein